MLDILAIKADVYQLERQGKRLPVYRYLREVWQKEPPSEGLTVLALQQMVDYVEYVDAQNSAIKFYVFTLSGQHRLISNKKNAAAFHSMPLRFPFEKF